MRCRIVALAATAAALGVVAAPAGAAAPRYVLVTGAGLERPVVLANWRENLAFELAVAGAPRAVAPGRLPVRGRLALALFWVARPAPPRTPAAADQRGWLYPATPARPAVIALRVDGRSALRLVTGDLRRILARHRVPLGP
jgi:hypothetical protein